MGTIANYEQDASAMGRINAWWTAYNVATSRITGAGFDIQVIELLAIAIAGGAGLHIGRSMVFSGERTRLEAASVFGRQAAMAMVGVIIMLLIAGVLEGVGRQSINVTEIRFAIAGGTALLWGLYLFLPRRSRVDG